MVLFDSLIQLKLALDVVQNRIPIIGGIYCKIIILITKFKLRKLKESPASDKFILGFYKFMSDIGNVRLEDYKILYSETDERSWMRTIMIENQKEIEFVSLSVFGGNMINVKYENMVYGYEIVVEENLYNFEYTEDRYMILTKVNKIFMDCVLSVIYKFLERKDSNE